MTMLHAWYMCLLVYVCCVYTVCNVCLYSVCVCVCMCVCVCVCPLCVTDASTALTFEAYHL